MTDQETIATYDARVADYAELTTEKEPDALLAAFMNRLKPGDAVLDLGCGPAQASAFMRAFGLQPDPVDASAEMVKLANDTHAIDARQATFEEICSGDATGVYQGVWANFSLLHAPREKMPDYLRALHTAMVPGGVLHLAMKLGTDSKRDTLGRFYTYYSKEELETLLAAAGFTVKEYVVDEELGLAGDVEPWIAFTALIKGA